MFGSENIPRIDKIIAGVADKANAYRNGAFHAAAEHHDRIRPTGRLDRLNGCFSGNEDNVSNAKIARRNGSHHQSSSNVMTFCAIRQAVTRGSDGALS